MMIRLSGGGVSSSCGDNGKASDTWSGDGSDGGFAVCSGVCGDIGGDSSRGDADGDGHVFVSNSIGSYGDCDVLIVVVFVVVVQAGVLALMLVQDKRNLIFIRRSGQVELIWIKDFPVVTIPSFRNGL